MIQFRPIPGLNTHQSLFRRNTSQYQCRVRESLSLFHTYCSTYHWKRCSMSSMWSYCWKILRWRARGAKVQNNSDLSLQIFKKPCHTDPIFTCDRPCGNILWCGNHTCQKPCHKVGQRRQIIQNDEGLKEVILVNPEDEENEDSCDICEVGCQKERIPKCR